MIYKTLLQKKKKQYSRTQPYWTYMSLCKYINYTKWSQWLIYDIVQYIIYDTFTCMSPHVQGIMHNIRIGGIYDCLKLFSRYFTTSLCSYLKR